MASSTEVVAPRLGNAEKIMYAQQIIDAFSKSIDAGGCLNKIPIAIHSQAQAHEQALQDILTSIGQKPTETHLQPDQTFNFIRPKSFTVQNSPTFPQPPFVQQGVTDSNIDPSFLSSMKLRLNNECIPCGITLPNFQLNGVFSGILAQIGKFITDVEGFFKNLKPSYCHFAYFLSFLCIPDLVKMLAVILGRIIQLTSSVNLINFSVSIFIQGILGSILDSIMSIVMSIINFAQAPITCLLNSIQNIIDKIPTQASLARDLTDAQYRLLTGKEKPAAVNNAATDPYLQAINDQYKSISGLLRNEFMQAETIIKNASDGIEAILEDLIGLKNFTQCENERNGDIFTKLEDIAELIQMANLISSLLKKKVKNATADALCRYTDQPSVSTSTNPLSIDEIAQVIQDVNGGTVVILQSDANQPLGIIVNPVGPKPSDNNLSIYACNMATFIRDNTLDSIITQAVIAADSLIGKAPGIPLINIGGPISRININKVQMKPGDIQILFNTNDTTPTDIISEINKIYGYNPLQDKSELNYFSVVNPKTDLGAKLTVADVNASITNLAKTGTIGQKQLIIPINVVSGSIISKPLQIKCGSIENIKSNLGLIMQSI
jgi:hypothetical protein